MLFHTFKPTRQMFSASQKQKSACLSCRAIKVRCDREPPQVKCSRCSRLKLDCVVKLHRRGRRLPLTSTSVHCPSGPSSSPSEVLMQVDADFNSSSSNPPTTSSSFTTPPSLGSRSPRDSFSADPEEQDQTLRDSLNGPGSSIIPFDHTASSVTQLLAEEILDDPITRGYMPRPDAELLFFSYFIKLNPMIAALDSCLCSFNYTRKKSSVLFTAILTVAAKFDRRDLYESCLQLSHHHLSLVWISGACSVEIIQAILILIFYKEPTDSSAYRKAGFAIRMAYELGLDLPHSQNRPLPRDELQAREILARERTWYQLVSFDGALARQHSKPAMIATETVQDPQKWLLDNVEYRLDIDPFIAAKADLGGLEDVTSYKQLFSGGGPPSLSVYAQRAAMIRANSERLDRWGELWIEQNKYSTSPSSLALLHYFQCMCQFHLAEAFHRHIRNRPLDVIDLGKDAQAFITCFGAALALLDQINHELSEDGRLRYAQDYVSTGSAQTALWLFTHLGGMDKSMKGAVVHIFEKATRTFRAAARADHEAPAYQARFFNGLLQSISTEDAGRVDGNPSISTAAVNPPTDHVSTPSYPNITSPALGAQETMQTQGPLNNDMQLLSTPPNLLSTETASSEPNHDSPVSHSDVTVMQGAGAELATLLGMNQDSAYWSTVFPDFSHFMQMPWEHELHSQTSS